MSRKKRKDQVIGITQQPVGKAIANGMLFFGILASIVFFFPHYSQLYLLPSLIIGLVGVAAFVWLNLYPDLRAKFLFYVSLATLCTMAAVRIFNYLLPDLKIIGIVIILTVVISHSLPIVSPELTRFLRGELSFAPKTWFGRFLLKGSLFLLPIAGFIGATMGLFARGDTGELDITMLIMAPILWFLAIMLPFSTSRPISPWEGKVQSRTEKK
jgi:hypothetical protein